MCWITSQGLEQLGPTSRHVTSPCRQREAEAAEEREVQGFMRKRREREAAEEERKANKREARDRWQGGRGGSTAGPRHVRGRRRRSTS